MPVTIGSQRATVGVAVRQLPPGLDELVTTAGHAASMNALVRDEAGDALGRVATCVNLIGTTADSSR